jgi:hypothetical protein
VFVHGLQGHPRRTWTWSPPSASSKKPGRIVLPSSAGSKGDRTQKSNPFHRLRSFQKRKDSEEIIESRGSDNVEEDGTGISEPKEIFWPEDLLKVDFPKARIMTFGYDSIITQGYKAANQSSIFSHAKNLLFELEQERRKAPNRDLIFIAHSLGGILTKEVLRRSHTDPDIVVRKIFDCTTGVFFFGTPHRGSKDWASFGKGVASIAGGLLGMDANTDIISALVSGHELECSQEDFIAQWREHRERLTVRTFQESRAVTGISWGGFNQLVLQSSTSGTPTNDLIDCTTRILYLG